MEDMSKLGTAIRRGRVAQSPRMSQAKLGDKLGVSRASINMWERGKQVPTEQHMRAIMRTLKVDLIAYMPVDAVEAFLPIRNESEYKTVPVYRSEIAAAGTKYDFIVGGEIVKRVQLPPRLADRSDLRAVIVATDTMVPRYMQNEVVIVGNSRHPEPGDFVLITLKPQADSGMAGPKKPVLLRHLVARKDGKMRLAQFNPPRVKVLAVSDIETCEVVYMSALPEVL